MEPESDLVVVDVISGVINSQLVYEYGIRIVNQAIGVFVGSLKCSRKILTLIESVCKSGEIGRLN